MKSAFWTTIVALCIFKNVSCEFAGHDGLVRSKRQSNPGDAFVDAVFQIPIQTLTSVGSLVKATRPVIMQVRQRIQQSLSSQPQRFSLSGSGQQPQATSYQRPSRAHNRVSQSYQQSQGYQWPQAGAYQQPQATSYQRPSRAHQRPTSTYNKLNRASTATNQFFRDSNNV